LLIFGFEHQFPFTDKTPFVLNVGKVTTTANLKNL